MPRPSKQSFLNLITCHKDLQIIFTEVMKVYDCTITCGFRNKTDQEEAFQKGTSKLHFPHSKHNTIPSRALDAVPYPVDWDDIERFKEFAEKVKEISNKLFSEEKISSKIKWGGDWKTFKDYSHWEIE